MLAFLHIDFYHCDVIDLEKHFAANITHTYHLVRGGYS
ncbi:hypothetical protein PPEP_b0273 [Pseudoalteromonas peptidolytica F12-50-A1]|uniref:Uncharacterized protein n=1 Tax=Pseudoalteromonas peptidolytica F12-50-A1 TaxID=1315280 RepID=A0A8I0T7S4_9GAMM|nr:hypothetical protein [Pseudoalteromonas peptidolytica F12-50-A1]